VVDRAKGRWDHVLSTLGISSDYLDGKKHGCPVCRAGEDRFFFDDAGGSGSFFCNHCGAGYGLDLVQRVRGVTVQEAAKLVADALGNCSSAPKRDGKKQKPTRDPRPRLRRIAKEAQRLTGSDPVSRYLSGRGFLELPRALRWHPGLKYFVDGRPAGTYAAMLAIVSTPEGFPATYHVTYLADGKKAPVGSPRKVLPPVTETIAGGAVRLYPVEDHLGIAEGIETALAVWELYGVPTWAVISTSGMKSFVVPDGVSTLTVYADNDANFAGQRAAYELAGRVGGDLTAAVEVPPEPGTDWNDVLLAVGPQPKKAEA
jgi:putative DNA primase/helicase